MSKKPVVLIKHDEITTAVDRIADEIRRDYRYKNPLLIGILKGSFIFMADLVRRIKMPLEVDFIRVSSYGSNTESSGKIKVVSRPSSRIKNRHVIIVEDIIDTGLTTKYVIDLLIEKHPASLKLCALTEKPARRKLDIHVDYLGFSVPDKFIVGYGIDWDEKYRYLPDICYIE